MKTYSTLLLSLLCWLTAAAQERILVLNEGTWQGDNGRVSYFEDGRMVTNQWFVDANTYKLGDTPNHIVEVRPDLLAIAVNGSNIVQFVGPDGTAVAAVEDVPNNRQLATDGRYVYVTSFAHECTVGGRRQTFKHGYVAKIDTETFSVVTACEVGYEPDGIALYNGHLFVANTGGYAYQEDHDYEQTVSIVDAATMTITGTIDTGCINLYGQMSQSGRYLLINSCGDYYETPACAVLLDCEAALSSQPSVRRLDAVVTYNTPTRDGRFLCIGSTYSFTSGGYDITVSTIDPQRVFAGSPDAIEATLPGTMAADIAEMAMPYSIYVNPYTGYLYATDAASSASAGKLYQWSPEGQLLGSWKTYINPSHLLALCPDPQSISSPLLSTTASQRFDLCGRRLPNDGHKGFVIERGRKVFN